MKRVPQLDGLRGVAILLVVLGHYLAYHVAVNDLELAPTGVSIFFALSGYLICSLLIGERDRSGSIDMKQFYWRRMLRLWPALLAFLAVLLLIWKWLPAGDMRPMTWILSVFYLRDVAGRGLVTGHLWSLSLEEQFYLFWPWFLARFKYRSLTLWTFGLILAITILRTTRAYLHPELVIHGDIYLHPWYRADSVLSGCMVALLVHKMHGARLLHTIARVVPLAVWVVLLFATGFLPEGGPYLALSLVLSFFIVFGCVVREQDLLVRCLKARWLGVIGDYSYSIYLWQQVFLVVRLQPPLRFLSNPPWNILAIAVLAIASRQLVEKPFLKLRNRRHSHHSQPVEPVELEQPLPTP